MSSDIKKSALKSLLAASQGGAAGRPGRRHSSVAYTCSDSLSAVVRCEGIRVVIRAAPACKKHSNCIGQT